MTEYPTLSQLILEGQPGDYFHDMPTGPDRGVTTYVLRKSYVEEEKGKVHEVGNTVGIFHKLSTMHFGKSELYGRPSYCYISSVGEHRADTEEDSIFVRHVFSMDMLMEPFSKVEAKRYGRKKLLNLHDEALAEQGFPSLTYK